MHLVWLYWRNTNTISDFREVSEGERNWVPAVLGNYLPHWKLINQHLAFEMLLFHKLDNETPILPSFSALLWARQTAKERPPYKATWDPHDWSLPGWITFCTAAHPQQLFMLWSVTTKTVVKILQVFTTRLYDQGLVFSNLQTGF